MEPELLKELLMPLIVFFTALVILLIIRKIFFTSINRLAFKTETKFDDMVLGVIKAPSFWWVVAISLYIAIGSSALPTEYSAYGLKAIYALIVFSVTLVAANISTRLFQRSVDSSEAKTQATGLSKTIIKFIILAIGFLIILNGLGVSVTPLLTALGVGGLAVALALQDTLSNLFAGVHIIVERPLRVGDYVKLDSGEEGYVSDIGWRTTKIRKLGNNLIIIPNNRLAQSTITNFNMPEKRMSLLIPVGVSYDNDPQVIEDILLEVAKGAVGNLKGLATERDPIVRFSPGFGDSSLDFTLICQVTEFVDQYLVQSELRKLIFKRFKEEGVEIPFPVRTVYLKKEPDGV
ncbi:MAG: mechanosensitive ion channel family protein [Deltaproteobacteria bacterium]|nr:mechanosensitive ion channel family protein [Deltaproteobacteria bacterium]